MRQVPDFFQDESEEALRDQVGWQHDHLGLDDAFFSRLLGHPEDLFTAWKAKAMALDPAQEEVLRSWWRTVLHLLSFQGFDEEKLRSLLKPARATGSSEGASPLSPPWSASSLRAYLEGRGAEAIGEVDQWLESFRFGDPYAPPRRPSSTATER